MASPTSTATKEPSGPGDYRVRRQLNGLTGFVPSANLAIHAPDELSFSPVVAVEM